MLRKIENKQVDLFDRFEELEKMKNPVYYNVICTEKLAPVFFENLRDMYEYQEEEITEAVLNEDYYMYQIKLKNRKLIPYVLSKIMKISSFRDYPVIYAEDETGVVILFNRVSIGGRDFSSVEGELCNIIDIFKEEKWHE